MRKKGGTHFMTIPDVLSELIGLSCCQARISIGNQLVLDFGNKIFYDEPTLKGLFHGEWTLSSEMSSWRLIKDNNIIYGDGDGEGEGVMYADVDLNLLLQNLVGHSLIDISNISLYDVRFSFDSSYEVHFMAQSRKGYYLSILAPKDQFIAFEPGNKWVQESSLIPMEFTEEEKIYNNHSEHCYKRWQKVINQVTKNMCNECAYYILLSRGFYFGDFGLCSNELSPYDGRVVGISSGCDFFAKTLKG